MEAQEIKEFKEHFTELRGDMYQVKTALLGNEFNNHQGFVYKLIELEKDIFLLQSWKEEEKIRIAVREAREKRTMAMIKVLVSVLTGLSILWGFYITLKK